MSSPFVFCTKKHSFFTSMVILFIFTCMFVVQVSGASFSSYSYIDTKGSVIESQKLHSSVSTLNTSSSAAAYSGEVMTNGGRTNEVSTLTFSSAQVPAGVNNLETSKVMSYDAGTTGSSLMAKESVSMENCVNSSDQVGVCPFSGAQTLNQGYEQISAETSLTGVTSMSYNSHSAVKFLPEDGAGHELEFQFNVVPDKSTGKTSAQGTVTTDLTYSREDQNYDVSVKDSSVVSGLIDFMAKMISLKNSDLRITEQSSATGTVIEDTEIEHTYEYEGNQSITSDDRSSQTAYNAKLLTTGGDTSIVKDTELSERLETDIILNYESNQTEGGSMISSEHVSLTKSGSIEGACSEICPFAPALSAGQTTEYFHRAEASAEMIGLAAVNASTSSRVSTTDASDSVSTGFEYRSDITSKPYFEESLNLTVNDADQDGRYEDINGNGRLDFNDLVILFDNFGKISNSTTADRYDYNGNERFDFADLICFFNLI